MDTEIAPTLELVMESSSAPPSVTDEVVPTVERIALISTNACDTFDRIVIVEVADVCAVTFTSEISGEIVTEEAIAVSPVVMMTTDVMVAEFPAPSVARQVTVVVPSGKPLEQFVLDP